MNAVADNAVPHHKGSVQATSGEFAGWWTWPENHFEAHNGPFWHRIDGTVVRCAARLQTKNLSPFQRAHGGFLLAFADFCMSATSLPATMGDRVVTLTCAAEFIGTAKEGELLEGNGEIIRNGRSVIFIRGLISTAGRPVLNFSGSLKRVGESV